MSAVHEVVGRGDAPRHRCVLPDHPADARHSPYHERFEPRVDAETQRPVMHKDRGLRQCSGMSPERRWASGVMCEILESPGH
jgi:hypothetical protein